PTTLSTVSDDALPVVVVAPTPPPTTALVVTEDASITTGAHDDIPRSLPWYTTPLMLTHLAVSGDIAQHTAWKERVEGIHMVEALARVRGHKVRAMLRKPRAWQLVRRSSAAAAVTNLAAVTPWLLWLIPLYAVGHGFGWLAALTFLLPVPIAWKVGRRLYQDAAIASLREAGLEQERNTSPARRWIGGAARSFTAGFGFGFTLLFLQGLISWFMTPAPTLGLELLLDAYLATVAGIFSGGISMLVTPLIAVTGRAALNAARQDEPRQLKA
ncbi:MAG: hypothetical protein AAFX99_35620, partial [Myxococcota bacterium]